eukprot:TRINITY_DN1934_c0_g1_i5.p1 TRINITY_DN1934_c0_g1~~TRINITY_DN1934_c0_g1_i5.p1  ORF type:complete len:211 (-),score=22.49 TRINITY_DN1934_c0_g1_i5:107-739(-)
MCIRDRYMGKVNQMATQKLRTHQLIGFTRTINQLYNPKPLVHKTPAKMTHNMQQLSSGIEQRKSILPNDVSYQGNEKKIGFYQGNTVDTRAQYNPYVHQKRDFFTRHARIFIKDVNHMHLNPTVEEGYAWTVQFERQGVHKTPVMGWTQVADSQSKRTLKFATLENAIEYCLEMGLGYEVQYPHFRYHRKKSYAHNFNWKGEPKEEEDII